LHKNALYNQFDIIREALKKNSLDVGMQMCTSFK
jgi:hypothetical protein